MRSTVLNGIKGDNSRASGLLRKNRRGFKFYAKADPRRGPAVFQKVENVLKNQNLMTAPILQFHIFFNF